MIFSHWQPIDGDIAEEGSMPQRIVLDVRKRKGLKEEMPDFADYYDKL